jgi:ABC-2 type transport system permease protein
MKIIGYIVQKEFRQIFRNKAMLPIIFLMPIIQLLILSHAATFDVKNIKFSFIDSDRTSTSRGLINKFEASKYFNVLDQFSSKKIADEAMENGTVDVTLEIPRHFERDLVKEKTAALAVYTNAIDGAKAGVENVYINQIIREYNQNISTELLAFDERRQPLVNILTIPAFWYNKTLNYKTFMVPGILVLLVTMITLFLSGMNIVKEKEMGTLEQINVTPIRKSQFIIGKLFPFWVLGMVLLTVGLIIAKLIFDVPMVGNIGLIYLFTSVYILLILGLGLFISNYTETQQQAMFIAWFLMVIFILMSGLFTPIESMPTWAQNITLLNPIRYYVEVIRMVMLKGSGFMDVISQLSVISGFAFLMNGLAVWSYKKLS